MADETEIILLAYPNNPRESMKSIAKESAIKALAMVGYYADIDVEYFVDTLTGNEYIKLSLTDLD